MRFVLIILIPIVCLSAPIEKGFYVSGAFGASYNPIGIISDCKAFYRMPLIKEKGLLWESTHFDIGIQDEWTPTDNLIATYLMIEPIGFFNVLVKAGYYSMYTGLGNGYLHLENVSDYGQDTRKKTMRTDASGYWLIVKPTIQLKIERVIFVNSLTVNNILLNKSGNYLEYHTYLPHKARDLDFVNDCVLLYEANKSVLTGMRYHYVNVDKTSLLSHGLSCLAILGAFEGPFKNSYAALSVGTYLDDPLFRHKMHLGLLVGKEFLLLP